jgi:immune inhibitor A
MRRERSSSRSSGRHATVRGPYGPFTANAGGTAGAISETIPAAATSGLTADATTGFKTTVGVEVVDAAYTDTALLGATGQWAAKRAGAGAVTLGVPPDGLLLENSFVSGVGWVKPGATYPFRVFVRNFTSNAATGAAVTIPVPDGTTFTNATALGGSGTCSVGGGAGITWTIGTVAAAGADAPTIKTCVVEARADTTNQDPQIVWKNLSSTATLSYDGGPAGGIASTSHGPKVIPESEIYDTARYGDRPFPVVPVDYFDRKHAEAHTGDLLAEKINSPDIPGSTFNLYQEMSYGQLFPNGTVPSAGIASRDWSYEPDFQFSELQPQGACHGATLKDARGTPVYDRRIVNGWYQLPGTTDYYGDDRFGPGSLVGAIAGVGAIFAIDDACGPTGKAVYDAAQIADPEIDYSDFDTDKDGVVDFFMMVFAGIGGNGASQTSVPPYDNIWPHSSSLEFYFSNQGPYGQQGYVSDDQLKDLEGRPLYYTDGGATTMTTSVTAFPVYVRVGPYNVNPEAAIDRASVISHEYGHSLGLPDFYSTGSRATYGDWNLMATDKSQNMDVFSKQELGWAIPRVLEPGSTLTATGWRDSKVNTHRIDWQAPSGTPYTLTGPSVNNGEAYVAKLPSRKIFDEAKFDAAGPGEGATPDHVWWSRAGNDFNCPPNQGHNLDVFLPELAALPAGTQVTVTFKSLWDIEWDYDYGFVLASTDGGESYRSLPSAKGYTTSQAQNPNGNSCQLAFGNGLTGTSGSYEAGTQELDRLIGVYPDPGFVTDEYDLSQFAGESTVLRFSYATDPGLTRPGWFIDDLKITAGDTVIFETDFESSGDPADPRVFNGGCKDQTRTATTCTAGWQYVDAAAGSVADHAYYLELRDRSGFDFNGRGENDRAAIEFLPGLLLVYTDEAHCYGNPGCDDPPGQSPLDSQPQPGNRTPNLHDAAFTAAAGDNRFSDSPPGWVDNYTDPSRADSRWRFDFNCLTFDVTSMTGESVGPDPGTGPATFDLAGDVRFVTGSGCAPFDYGHGGGAGANTAPTAVAQARPTSTTVGQAVEFDGSGSFDQETPAGDLVYEWDFNGDGTYDAAGATAMHVYTAAGTFDATLRVTDEGGLGDTDVVVVTVASDTTTGGTRVHGSGHIAGTTAKQSIPFDFSAATKDGVTTGKLQYDKTKSGLALKGNVTALTVSGTAAELRGSCVYRGGACTYVANVQDSGGSGKNKDSFAIQVFDSNGTKVHERSGTLQDGNIKIG